MPLKLFQDLAKSAVFYFYDKPSRLLVKSNGKHYAAPEGRRVIHPHVAVVEVKTRVQPQGSSIYDKLNHQKGDSGD